jgi:hypothetical protein
MSTHLAMDIIAVYSLPFRRGYSALVTTCTCPICCWVFLK